MQLKYYKLRQCKLNSDHICFLLDNLNQNMKYSTLLSTKDLAHIAYFNQFAHLGTFESPFYYEINKIKTKKYLPSSLGFV